MQDFGIIIIYLYARLVYFDSADHHPVYLIQKFDRSLVYA
jgi:hypothetical protein